MSSGIEVTKVACILHKDATIQIYENGNQFGNRYQILNKYSFLGLESFYNVTVLPFEMEETRHMFYSPDHLAVEKFLTISGIRTI